MSSDLVWNIERAMGSCQDPMGAVSPENGYPFREHHFPPESFVREVQKSSEKSGSETGTRMFSRLERFELLQESCRTEDKPKVTALRRHNDRRFTGKRTWRIGHAHDGILRATSGKSGQARECSPRIMSYRSMTAATPTSGPSSSSRLSTRTTRP